MGDTCQIFSRIVVNLVCKFAEEDSVFQGICLKLKLETFLQALENLKDSLIDREMKECLCAIDKLIKSPWILGFPHDLGTRQRLREVLKGTQDSFICYLLEQR